MTRFAYVTILLTIALLSVSLLASLHRTHKTQALVDESQALLEISQTQFDESQAQTEAALVGWRSCQVRMREMLDMLESRCGRQE